MADVLYPIFDRILVRRKESETRTASGLYIADAAQEKPQEGYVLAVGDEVKRVRQGDRVMFAKYEGNEIPLGEEKFIIMKEESVLGILNRNPGPPVDTKHIN